MSMYLLSINFKTDDEELFNKWISEGQRKKVFIKQECILREKEDNDSIVCLNCNVLNDFERLYCRHCGHDITGMLEE